MFINIILCVAYGIEEGGGDDERVEMWDVYPFALAPQVLAARPSSVHQRFKKCERVQ